MNLQRMKHENLLDLAKANGLAAHKQMTREQLIELLESHSGDIRDFTNPDQLSGKKVTVMIHAGDAEKGEHRPVMCGLNGKVWKIPRGIDVTIPIEVYQGCINDAVEINLVQQGVNKETFNIEYGERRRPRFSVTANLAAA